MTEQTTGLPDLLAPGLDVVFCGLNPGKRSALEQIPFFNRSNRFWRTLWLAGFTPEQIDPNEYVHMLRFGCGLTTAVPRATASAQELALHEYRDGARELEKKIDHFQPRFLAFLGKPAYAAITAQRTIEWGVQPQPFAGAQVWVLPNPSGRNLSFSLERLVESYQQLRRVALPDRHP